MFVSGLYCSQRFQNIIPYYTRVYRKLTAVYKTGTGVKGTLGHVWGLWDLGTSSMGHLGQGCGASNTVDAGIWMIIAKIRGKSLPDLPRLIETKHFPESKTLPRKGKYIPESKIHSRIQNTSQNTKQVPESKTVLDSGKCFVPVSHCRYLSLSSWICFGEATHPTLPMVPEFTLSSMQRVFATLIEDFLGKVLLHLSRLSLKS